jgi:hypothetical protein
VKLTVACRQQRAVAVKLQTVIGANQCQCKLCNNGFGKLVVDDEFAVENLKRFAEWLVREVRCELLGRWLHALLCK